MLRRNECRLNFKNRPVRTGDLKGGGPKPPATNRGSQEPAINRVKGPSRYTQPEWALCDPLTKLSVRLGALC